MKAWIGTYTGKGSAGIYFVDLHEMRLSVRVAATSVNPSYLTLSPDNRFLYAVIESDNYKNNNGGAVSCYAIDGDTLTFVNEQLISGGSPCHLVCNKNMDSLICSNFGGGFAAVFSLNSDGSIGNIRSIIKQEIPCRTSHVHQAMFTPDESMLAVTDLGLDTVHFYEFHPKSGVGMLLHTLNFPLKSGPRHTVFGNNGYFYVACEISNEVMVCHISNQGTPTIVSRHSTLQTNESTSYCGAIRKTKDGSLLVSNRGEDSLALFTILPNGDISLRQHIPSGGSFPRDLAFSLDESLLLCANQRSGSLNLFSYANGLLCPLDRKVIIPDASCVTWF